MSHSDLNVYLLDQALKLALSIADDMTRAETLDGLAVAYAEAGRLPQVTARLAEALAWVRCAEEAGKGTSFTRRAIPETAVDLGLIDHAVQVASALDHHQVADIDRRTILLEALADIGCNLGDYDLALQAAHGMGPGRVKRFHPQTFHLALIAGALAKHGDWERALQVAEAILEGGDKTSAFDDIATAYIDAGRYQEALQTVQRIGPPDDRTWAMVWALIRISRLQREGSPWHSLAVSIPAWLQLMAPRRPR